MCNPFTLLLFYYDLVRLCLRWGQFISDANDPPTNTNIKKEIRHTQQCTRLRKYQGIKDEITEQYRIEYFYFPLYVTLIEEALVHRDGRVISGTL